jgi:hypothetical protein
MIPISLCFSLLIVVFWLPSGRTAAKKRFVLNLSLLQNYVEAFNRYDEELYYNAIRNTAAFSFLQDNIPLIDIPDKDIQETYYFRWWTYRKHIKRLPTQPLTYVITEFMATVPWAGAYNTINCAAGHHFREGRWLHDTSFLESYARFWFRPVDGGNPRAYSFWPANAIWSFYRIAGSSALHLFEKLFDSLAMNYEIMIRNNFDSKVGLWYNRDIRDGMESSIGGRIDFQAYRPTLNSYMIAEARMLSKLARLLNKGNRTQEIFWEHARRASVMMESYLWDSNHSFYKAVPRRKSGELKPVEVRELHGYTPWYFNLPPRNLHLEAWRDIINPKGFFAACGLTTAEQRDPHFALEYSYEHECRWNGPSWPFATSITLTAMANILQDPRQELSLHREYLSNEVYYQQLRIYAKAHHRKIAAGEYGNVDAMVIPWIDENIHPYTGDWISRTLLKSWKNGTWSAKKGGKERGKDYNHSTFIDLILSGLIGFIPRSPHAFELRPLIPRGKLYPYLVNQLYEI